MGIVYFCIPEYDFLKVAHLNCCTKLAVITSTEMVKGKEL